MPFNPATGVYTPPNGAENAFPGQIIASATWNAIFTDISNALTQLGLQLVNWQCFNPRIISSPGNITVGVNDRIILIEASVPSIILPAAATKVNPVTIIGDGSTIFGSNTAILIPSSGELISGLSRTTLVSNYQSITLLPLAAGGWLMES